MRSHTSCNFELGSSPARCTRYLAALAGGLVLVMLYTSAAQARDLYTIRVLGPSVRDSTNKIRNVPDFFDKGGLEALIPGYDEDDLVEAALDLRGVPTSIVYLASDTFLTFTIAGQSVTLEGTSRDASAALFEDFLLGEIPGVGDLTTTDLLQAFLEFSPVDPVAGNPNSLQSMMAFADYAMGSRGPLLGETHPGEDLFGIGVGSGSFSGCTGTGCMDVIPISLPLNYAFNFEDSNLSLLVDFPIAATFTEDQWSVFVSFGLAAQYRFQPLCGLVRAVGCALTAGARIGGTGSIDVGALAILYSFSLTNHMEWELFGLRVGMVNYFGYSASIDGIEIGDFAFSYDLTNGIFRNGGYIADSFGINVLGQELGWEFFGAGTRYTGTDLYMDSSGEVGLALVSLGDIAGARYNKTRVSASYVWGRNYDGASIKLDFLF